MSSGQHRSSRPAKQTLASGPTLAAGQAFAPWRGRQLAALAGEDAVGLIPCFRGGGASFSAQVDTEVPQRGGNGGGGEGGGGEGGGGEGGGAGGGEGGGCEGGGEGGGDGIPATVSSISCTP